MTESLTSPGAAPVGHLQDLSATGQLAVLCLRGLGRRESELSKGLSAHFPSSTVAALIARCDDLMQFLARYARRPFMRHQPDCPCLGADEAAFAHLIELTETGEREDVLMFAMMMTRPDMAPCLLPLAEAFTLTLHRALAQSRRTMGCPYHQSTHVH